MKMVLNKQKGNMYGFVTHTWNVIKGKCIHDCSYCYMKRFPQKDLWFDESELKIDLGKGNFIFVGSSTDMFAENVPSQWIMKVLNKCIEFPENTYLFQSKNPDNFFNFEFPENTILGTTMETNWSLVGCKAPSPRDRAEAMSHIENQDKMITIEPIIDFDLEYFIELIKIANPKWVNIGADSNKKLTLKEPSSIKVEALINELKRFTEVKNKDNLKRLLI
jgi:DNA repair photolyase